MKLTASLLTVDTPINGVVYPKNVVKHAIEKSPEYMVGYVDFEKDSLEGAVFIANNIRLEANNVLADIRPFDTPNGQILEDLLSGFDLCFSMVGTGCVDEGTVT